VISDEMELEENIEVQSPAEQSSEKVVAELAEERKQVLEFELYLDEHPEEKPSETEEEEKQESFKREMLKTAITRIENAARTQADFEDVVTKWDTLEQNAARKVRYHELSRGDIPLEYDKAMDGMIFPISYMEPRRKQVMSGNFLDVIHDCPFELDELTADAAISQMMDKLKDDHKEIFYWYYIRQLSCVEIGRIRDQTDRNIRKTRNIIIGKLRKQLFKILKAREEAGRGLSMREHTFLQNEKTALDDSKDS